mmetsp:Transcript_83182/g.214277  ORF Transcript_83182/g.214277 Transcript_83182/m.214277 type:complete len:653 (+) Transcript_83182:863-2821(+)
MRVPLVRDAIQDACQAAVASPVLKVVVDPQATLRGLDFQGVGRRDREDAVGKADAGGEQVDAVAAVIQVLPLQVVFGLLGQTKEPVAREFALLVLALVAHVVENVHAACPHIGVVLLVLVLQVDRKQPCLPIVRDEAHLLTVGGATEVQDQRSLCRGKRQERKAEQIVLVLAALGRVAIEPLRPLVAAVVHKDVVAALAGAVLLSLVEVVDLMVLAVEPDAGLANPVALLIVAVGGRNGHGAVAPDGELVGVGAGNHGQSACLGPRVQLRGDNYDRRVEVAGAVARGALDVLDLHLVGRAQLVHLLRVQHLVEGRQAGGALHQAVFVLDVVGQVQVQIDVLRRGVVCAIHVRLRQRFGVLGTGLGRHLGEVAQLYQRGLLGCGARLLVGGRRRLRSERTHRHLLRRRCRARRERQLLLAGSRLQRLRRHHRLQRRRRHEHLQERLVRHARAALVVIDQGRLLDAGLVGDAALLGVGSDALVDAVSAFLVDSGRQTVRRVVRDSDSLVVFRLLAGQADDHVLASLRPRPGDALAGLDQNALALFHDVLLVVAEQLDHARDHQHVLIELRHLVGLAARLRNCSDTSGEPRVSAGGRAKVLGDGQCWRVNNVDRLHHARHPLRNFRCHCHRLRPASPLCRSHAARQPRGLGPRRA